MDKSQITVRLDKGKLARARKVLGATTITETIDRALTLVTEKAAHDSIVRKYSGVGRKDSFGER
jgi:hypothetical protein